MATFEITSCIHGYHHYQSIWIPELGDSLLCEREPTNFNDRYAVSVVKDDIIIGYLPKAIPWICSIFLLRNGTIDCTVVGTRRYLADLPQGGLEIPCKLIFNGKCKDRGKKAFVS